MKSELIEGHTRIIGESQGYTGLAVRDGLVDCTVGGPGTPEMTTAWRPSPEELAALAAGGLVHVRLIGTAHPPIIIEVLPPVTDGSESGSDEFPGSGGESSQMFE